MPGPEHREHPCAGACGTDVEGVALCDECRARYRSLGETATEHLTEAERVWMDLTRETMEARR